MKSASHIDGRTDGIGTFVWPGVANRQLQANRQHLDLASRSMHYGEHGLGGCVLEGGENAFTTFKTYTTFQKSF